MATALLATAACTSGGSDDGPPVDQFTLGAEPLWDVTGLPEFTSDRAARKVTFVGDTVLVNDGTRLTAVEAETGEPRWTFGLHDPLEGEDGTVRPHDIAGAVPQILGDPTGDDWSLLIQYQHLPSLQGGEAPPYEQGLAALSARDGKVRWKIPMGYEPVQTELVDVNEQYAILSTHIVEGRSALVDLKSRKTVWEHEQAAAYSLSGQTMLLITPFPGQLVLGPGPLQKRPAVRTVSGASTPGGEVAWEYEAERSPATLTVAKGLLAVAGDDPSSHGGATEILDSRTGELRHQLEEPVICESGPDENLIACISPESGELTVLDAASGDKVADARPVTDEEDRDFQVSGIWEDRVFLGKPSREEGRKGMVVDRYGNVLDADLPGQAVGVSASYAAFHTADGLPVYRVVEEDGSDGSGAEGPSTAESQALAPREGARVATARGTRRRRSWTR